MQTQARPSAGTACFPARLIERLVGRSEELSRLDAELSRIQRAPAEAEQIGCGLVGPHGIGKSRLAIAYAEIYGPLRFPGGIFWIDASASDAYVEARLYQIARALRPAVTELQVLRASGRRIVPVLIRALQERPFDEPILMLLDGLAPGPATLLGELYRSLPLLSKKAVRVLTTSRDIEPIQGASIVPIPLDALPEEDAVALLTDGWEQSTPDAPLVRDLAARAGYLPLALTLLNRMGRAQEVSPAELLGSAQNENPRPPLTPDSARVRDDSEINGKVAFALDVTYRRVPDRVRRAAHVLAYLAEVPVPMELVDAVGEAVWDGDTRVQLAAYGLLSPRREPHRQRSPQASCPSSPASTDCDRASEGPREAPAYEPNEYLESLEPAVATWLRERGEPPIDDLLFVCGVLKQHLRPDLAYTVHNGHQYTYCLPHGDALLSHLAHQQLNAQQATAVVELGMRMGLWRRAQSLLSELEKNDRSLWQLSAHQLGENHLQTLSCMDNAALTLRAQGQTEAAEALYQQILTARRASKKCAARGTLEAMALSTTLNNYSLALKARGKLQEARELQQQNLQARSELFGTEHPLTLTAMNNLASTLYSLGDSAQARRLLEQAVAVRAKTLGDEHTATLSTMEGLASLLTSDDELPAAIEILERVLSVREKNFGTDHPATLATINNLALVLALKGDLEASRRWLEKALAIQSDTHADDHPSRLASLASLAPILHLQGDLEGERKLRAEELSVRKSAMGSDYPETISAMSNLVLTLAAKGDLNAARTLQDEELAICQKAFGENHPSTIASMNNLAVILQQQGDLENAGRLLERVVEIHKKAMGPLHPDTLTSMSNYASLIKARGDIEGARWLQENILEKRKLVLGDEHPDTLISMNNLATTLKIRGDMERSRRLQEEVLRIRAKVLGVEHADTLTAMNNLAVVLKAKGKLSKARKMQEHVVKKRKQVLGVEHPDTLTAMTNLASILKAQRQLESALALEQEVLDIRKKLLGKEHTATTIAAWNFTSTLIRLRGGSAAREPLRENLMWLIDQERNALSGPQRHIQDMLQKLIRSGQDVRP